MQNVVSETKVNKKTLWIDLACAGSIIQMKAEQIGQRDAFKVTSEFNQVGADLILQRLPTWTS